MDPDMQRLMEEYFGPAEPPTRPGTGASSSANDDAVLRSVDSVQDSMQQQDLDLRLAQLSRLSARVATVSRLVGNNQAMHADEEDAEDELDLHTAQANGMLAEAIHGQDEMLKAVQSKVGRVERVILRVKQAQQQLAKQEQAQQKQAQQEQAQAQAQQARSQQAQARAQLAQVQRAQAQQAQAQQLQEAMTDEPRAPRDAELIEAARQLVHEHLDDLIFSDEANLPFLLRVLHGLTGIRSQQQRGKILQRIQQTASQDLLGEIDEEMAEEMAEEAYHEMESDDMESDEEFGDAQKRGGQAERAGAIPMRENEQRPSGRDRAAEVLSPSGRPKTSRGPPGLDPFHYVSPSAVRDKTSSQILHLDGDSSRRRGISFESSPVPSPAKAAADRRATWAYESFEARGGGSDDDESDDDRSDSSEGSSEDSNDETDSDTPFVLVSEADAADGNEAWHGSSVLDSSRASENGAQVYCNSAMGVQGSTLTREQLSLENEDTLEQLRERLETIGQLRQRLRRVGQRDALSGCDSTGLAVRQQIEKRRRLEEAAMEDFMFECREYAAAQPARLDRNSHVGLNPDARGRHTQTEVLNKRLLESLKAQLDNDQALRG